MLSRQHNGGKMRRFSPSGKDIGRRKQVQRIKHRATGMHSTEQNAAAGGNRRKVKPSVVSGLGQVETPMTRPRSFTCLSSETGESGKLALPHLILGSLETSTTEEALPASTGLFPEPRVCPFLYPYNMIDEDTMVTRLSLGVGQPALTTS